jgi:hypothetical protein
MQFSFEYTGGRNELLHVSVGEGMHMGKARWVRGRVNELLNTDIH